MLLLLIKIVNIVYQIQENVQIIHILYHNITIIEISVLMLHNIMLCYQMEQNKQLNLVVKINL